MAQRCSWIKRAFSLRIDNWRLQLSILSPNSNVLYIKPLDVDCSINPILYNIAIAWEIFTECFTKIDRNYRKVPIFANRNFTRNLNDNGLIDVNFFGRKFYCQHRDRIRMLTVDDCYAGTVFKSCADFSAEGLPLTTACWWRLFTAVSSSIKKIREY
jgi:hypothetical protein